MTTTTMENVGQRLAEGLRALGTYAFNGYTIYFADIGTTTYERVARAIDEYVASNGMPDLGSVSDPDLGNWLSDTTGLDIGGERRITLGHAVRVVAEAIAANPNVGTDGDVIEQVADAFLAMERLPDCSLFPSAWVPTFNRAFRGALRAECNNLPKTGMEEQLRDLITIPHTSLGRRVLARFADHGESWTSANENSMNGVGQGIVMAVTQVLDKDTTPVFPTGAGDLQHMHPAEYQALEAWANNDDIDLYPGVDEQAIYLRSLGAWVADSCGTTGQAKEFLGKVMDYKRARMPEPYRPFEVGTEWKVLHRNGSGFAFDEVVKVVPANHAGGGLDQPDELTRFGRIRAVSASTPTGGRWALMHATDLGLRVDPSPNVGTASESATPVMDVSGEVTMLRQRLETARQHHREDIALIEKVLNAEAVSRSWCSEYQDIINDKLNDYLHIKMDPDTDKEFEVTWTEDYRVTVSRSMTVMATDADAAVEKAQGNAEELGDSELADELRYNVSGERTDDEDWEAEEQG